MVLAREATVVIPTYNEAKNIHELIPAIMAAVPGIHILVVDDNSPDGTGAVVKEWQKKYTDVALVSRPGKQGFGAAYVAGFKEALERKEVKAIITMDGDLSHPPRYLPEMLSLVEGSRVVIGSRYTKGGGIEGWELWRKILSKGANFYCRSITHIPMKDCTGGFNAISVELLRSIDFEALKKFRGYAFLMALKYLLWARGGVFKEIPIIFKNRTEGASKMSQSIIREGILAPWRLISVSK